MENAVELETRNSTRVDDRRKCESVKRRNKRAGQFISFLAVERISNKMAEYGRGTRKEKSDITFEKEIKYKKNPVFR